MGQVPHHDLAFDDAGPDEDGCQAGGVHRAAVQQQQASILRLRAHPRHVPEAQEERIRGR